MLYGFELEFLSSEDRYLLKERFLRENIPALTGYSPEPDDDPWGIGEDGSIQNPFLTHFGVELRSPVFTWKLESQIAQIKQVITLLKSLGSRSHDSCGLHIHLSWEGGPTAQELIEANLDLSERLAIRTKPRRATYANPKLPPIHHHAAISVVPDENDNGRLDYFHSRHLEVRVFNAALDFRYVMKCIELSISEISKLLGQ